MRVALINMPYSPAYIASIQLAICKSILNSLRIGSDSIFLDLEFVRKTTFRNVVDFGSRLTRGFAEWTFARKLWSIDTMPDFLNEKSECVQDRFMKVRDKAEEFIDELSDRDWSSYDVVAFTSTYVQLLASLCLAKVIKKRYPNITTMFGGSGFFEEQSRELMTKLSWIDFIFIGEGERSFKKVMQCLKENEAIKNTTGVMYRSGNQIMYHGQDNLDIEELVFPDYTDFFEQLPRHRDILGKELLIPYEMSRNCYIADKSPCKFCSFYDSNCDSRFKMKPLDVVATEIDMICQRWGRDFNKISFADLTFKPRTMGKLVPKLMRLGSLKQHNIKFISFADAYLAPNELKLMKKVGWDRVNAGIENFHPGFLKCLNKPWSAIRGIYMLKCAKYYNVNIRYCLLLRVPFEKSIWYDELLEILHKVIHFKKPRLIQEIIILRFASYVRDDLVSGLVPAKFYSFMFPSSIDLEKIAYEYDYDKEGILANINKMKMIQEYCTEYQESSLKFLNSNKIEDTRNGRRVIHDISDEQFTILKNCSAPQHVYSPGTAWRDLVDRGLLLELRDEALSLVEIEEEDAERIESLPTMTWTFLGSV